MQQQNIPIATLVDIYKRGELRLPEILSAGGGAECSLLERLPASEASRIDAAPTGKRSTSPEVQLRRCAILLWIQCVEELLRRDFYPGP